MRLRTGARAFRPTRGFATRTTRCARLPPWPESSDLLPLADWIDAYEKLLYGEVERAGFLRSFLWDVTLKDASQEDVDARARAISPPRPGSVRIHNESEEWRAVTPDLKSEDTTALGRFFRNHILGGAGMPEHWYGGGGDVNRATAAEMGDPTFKSLAMRQTFIKHMLEHMALHQVLRRMDPTGATMDPSELAHDRVPVVEFPEMVTRDATAYASALQQVVVAGALALDRGLLDETSVVSLITLVASGLGADIDPVAALEGARADVARRAEADGFTEPDEDDVADDA